MRARGSSLLGLIVTALVVVPSIVFVLGHMSDHGPSQRMELTSADGVISISNSADGQAVLNAAPMLPGTHTTGDVVLANTGSGPESLTLDTGAPDDQPGPGGGRLSERLQLRVEDVSGSGDPTVVYDGSLTGLHLQDLGTLSAGEQRTYRFVVTFPDGGADGADNAYQGSSTSIGFQWTAGASGPADGGTTTTTPDTTTEPPVDTPATPVDDGGTSGAGPAADGGAPSSDTPPSSTPDSTTPDNPTACAPVTAQSGGTPAKKKPAKKKPAKKPAKKKPAKKKPAKKKPVVKLPARGKTRPLAKRDTCARATSTSKSASG